jgi:spore photoproduct lyase
VTLFTPEHIYVEREAADLPLVRQVIERCPGVPVELVPSAKELIAMLQRQREEVVRGKRKLLLCRNRGRFLDACPGTQIYRCCGYWVLTPGAGCPLDCTYCVLQAYLNNPLITLYANLQDMLDELEAAPELQNGSIRRIGTGEFMDSMALEHLTDFASFMLPFFRSRPGLVLELKTKTVQVEPLLKLDHGGSYIISWSLNTAGIVAAEEHGAAGLDERIAAAKKVIAQGYRVGFHFDPMIYHQGWEQGYRAVVEMLAGHIPPEAIAWVSIGALRFMPQLKSIAQRRFSGTRIYTGEFLPGFDGKMRYLQEIRLEMFTKMTGWLRDMLPGVFVYFCMENELSWTRSFGFFPPSNAALKELLDKRLEL